MKKAPAPHCGPYFYYIQYLVMLMYSFLAIILTCIMMYFDLPLIYSRIVPVVSVVAKSPPILSASLI